MSENNFSLVTGNFIASGSTRYLVNTKLVPAVATLPPASEVYPGQEIYFLVDGSNTLTVTSPDIADINLTVTTTAGLVYTGSNWLIYNHDPKPQLMTSATSVTSVTPATPPPGSRATARARGPAS